MLSQFFKSVIDMDRAAVLICDLNHTIVYLNPAAARRYAAAGGEQLVGKSLMLCHNSDSNQKIQTILDWFRENPKHNMIYTGKNEQENKDVYMVALRDEEERLIGYYEKHEYRNAEPVLPYQPVDETKALG